MATSVLDSILNSMVTQIQALGLTYKTVAIPVAVRKLPRSEEQIDTLPLIDCLSSEDRGESRDPWTTEDATGAVVKYPISVVFINASNADYTNTDVDLTARFREQICRQFQWGITGGTLPSNVDLFFAEVLPKPLYDESKLNQQYSYSGLSFRFWVSEPRTN